MPPFDLDVADRDWRRDYSPEELETLGRRHRELDTRAAARELRAELERVARPAEEPT